jgi:ADP-ribose pyrophosphatase YjhB (NUDIX family)
MVTGRFSLDAAQHTIPPFITSITSITPKEDSMTPQWLTWVQHLQAITRNGLTFATDPFDIARDESVRDIAAQIAATYSQTPVEHIRERFTQETGYTTPKIDVRGAVFHEGSILLVKERGDGLWTLPGGWADVNESPSAAVEREVVEESGYHTRAIKLLALYDKNKHAHPPALSHAYKLFFYCALLGGTSTPSVETTAVAFFPEDALPPLSLSRVTLAQVLRLFELSRHPEWPTEFD